MDIFKSGQPEFGNIDDEWANFNEQMGDYNQREAERQEFENVLDAAFLKVRDLLVDAGIKRYIDPDGKVEEELYHSFMESELTRLDEADGFKGDRMVHLKKALINYYHNRDIEGIMYQSIATLIHLDETNSNDMIKNHMGTEIKKTTQTEMWIHYNVSLDDERQRIFELKFPGEAFSLTREGDSVYTAVAMNTQHEFFKAEHQKLTKVDEAIKLAGAIEDEEAEDILQIVVSVAIDMNFVKQNSIAFGSEANVNSQLWELVRTIPRDVETQKRIVELFE